MSEVLKGQYKDIKDKTVFDFVQSMIKKNQYVKFQNLDELSISRDQFQDSKVLYNSNDRIDSLGMQKSFSYFMSIVEKNLQTLIED